MVITKELQRLLDTCDEGKNLRGKEILLKLKRMDREEQIWTLKLLRWRCQKWEDDLIFLNGGKIIPELRPEVEDE